MSLAPQKKLPARCTPAHALSRRITRCGLLATIAGVDDVLAALARPDGLDRLVGTHWRRIASGDVEPFGTRFVS